MASNPSPGPAYYDERTKMDKFMLSSTRVLGHGGEEQPLPQPEADEGRKGRKNRRLPTRRHILVTGGFGSLGKHVVRDLLLGSSSFDVNSNDKWDDRPAPSASDEAPMITIVDVRDQTDELNFLLQQSAELRQPLKVKGADPRTSKFTLSERTVQAFIDAGRLRIMTGDVRDTNFMSSLLAASSQGATRVAAFGDDGAVKRPSTSIPPISGIIHLASYAPSLCRLNPMDCQDVETQSMKAILGALTRDGLDHTPNLGSTKVPADRPWLVVPRRDDVWNEVSTIFHAFVCSC